MRPQEVFLPTRENDYTPHLLQKAAMLLMAGLILLTFVAVNIQTIVWLSSDWLVSTVLPAVVVEKTNEERDGVAATALQRSARLDEAARRKAEDMATHGYFSHYSPSGVSPWHWFEVVEYQYAHAGENLAVHFTDSEAVVEAWMNSPTHRANIVNGAYTEIGVGTAKGEYQGFDTVFVVQLFGTPAAPLQPPQPISVDEVTSSPEVTPETAISLPANTIVLGDVSPVVTMVEEEPEVIPSSPVLTRASMTFVATSSGLQSDSAAPVTTIGAELGGSTPPQSVLTMPNHVLRLTYLLLGALIAALLMLSIALGMRYHRPWQVVYGVGLLLLMSGLFYLHSFITAQVVVAAPSEPMNVYE